MFARSPVTVLCCTTTFCAGLVSLSAFSLIAAFVVLPQLSTILPTNAMPRGPIGALTLTIGFVVAPFEKTFHPRKTPSIVGRLPKGSRRLNSGRSEQPAA